MVKAIWAVACFLATMGGVLICMSGCATTPHSGSAMVYDSVPTMQNTDSGKNTTPQDPPNVPPGAEAFASMPSAAAPQYRIGPEDMLHISVWESKELTLDVVVRPDGMISLPLIQDVKAEGLTAAELATVLHNKLLDFIKVPQVFVVVTQVNASKIYIVGSVIKPGPYPLRGDMSVLQALSIAGGFTQFASPRKIKIIRNAGGKQEIRKVNYYEMLDDGTGNFLLKSGDTIVVP